MSGRQRRTVLGALAALLSAGCLRLTEANQAGSPAPSGSGDAPSAQGETPTPDGSPLASGEGSAVGGEGTQTVATGELTPVDSVDLPVGVRPDGVTEGVLVSHANVLADANYSVRFRERRSDFSTEELTRVASDRALITRDDGFARATTYVEGGVAYERAEQDGAHVFGFEANAPYPRERLGRIDSLRSLIQAGSYVPEGVLSRDGTEFVRLAAEGVDDSAALGRRFGEGAVRSLDGGGLVRLDGVVSRLSATAEFSAETRRFEVETGDVGSTSVERPAWADEARRRAPEFDVSLTDDARFVVATHVGGDPLDLGVDVNVWSEDTARNRHYHLRDGVGEGETLYVSRRGEDELAVASGSRPDRDPPAFQKSVMFSLYAGLDVLTAELSP